MGVICKKLNELVLFFSRMMYSKWNCLFIQIGVDNKSINPFWSNRTVQISKLVLYTVVYLIWCPYIDEKTTIFDPRILRIYFA